MVGRQQKIFRLQNVVFHKNDLFKSKRNAFKLQNKRLIALHCFVWTLLRMWCKLRNVLVIFRTNLAKVVSKNYPEHQQGGGARHFHLGGPLEGPVLQQGELPIVFVGLSERDLKTFGGPLGGPGKMFGGQWPPWHPLTCAPDPTANLKLFSWNAKSQHQSLTKVERCYLFCKCFLGHWHCHYLQIACNIFSRS